MAWMNERMATGRWNGSEWEKDDDRASVRGLERSRMECGAKVGVGCTITVLIVFVLNWNCSRSPVAPFRLTFRWLLKGNGEEQNHWGQVRYILCRSVRLRFWGTDDNPRRLCVFPLWCDKSIFAIRRCRKQLLVTPCRFFKSLTYYGSNK